MTRSIRIPVPTDPMPKPDRIITDLLDTEIVYIFLLWDGQEVIGRPIMATGDGFMLIERDGIRTIDVLGQQWINDRLITSIRPYDDPTNR